MNWSCCKCVCPLPWIRPANSSLVVGLPSGYMPSHFCDNSINAKGREWQSWSLTRWCSQPFTLPLLITSKEIQDGPVQKDKEVLQNWGSSPNHTKYTLKRNQIKFLKILSHSFWSLIMFDESWTELYTIFQKPQLYKFPILFKLWLFQVDPNDFQIFGWKGFVVFIKTCIIGLFCFGMVTFVVLLLLLISGSVSVF